MLLDNSLRVDPATLINGAQRLRATHDAMRGVLTAAHEAHDSLRSSWTGAAADTGQAMFTDVSDGFGKHLDTLAGNADDLHTAAGLYRDQDDTSGADLDAQM